MTPWSLWGAPFHKWKVEPVLGKDKWREKSEGDQPWRLVPVTVVWLPSRCHYFEQLPAQLSNKIKRLIYSKYVYTMEKFWE